MIARVCIGYRIALTNGVAFRVQGGRRLRGQYLYLLRVEESPVESDLGLKRSMAREELLELQRIGEAWVTL